MIVFSLCAISYSVDARPKKDTIPLPPSPVNRENLENSKHTNSLNNEDGPRRRKGDVHEPRNEKNRKDMMRNGEEGAERRSNDENEPHEKKKSKNMKKAVVSTFRQKVFISDTFGFSHQI